ncbi:MAG: MarR family transcriptional regulator [Beijerinckiaceae bacterium]|nr:MarR family transcriptional regulator [Beijerinckiaceae bacterium]MCZ8299214.1 MarR family transcriptional regulator [Beijerinckiaceae bacterium]
MPKTSNLPAPAAEESRETFDSGLDFDPLTRRLGYVVRRAQIAIFQSFFQTMSVAQISPAQYSALVIIARNPGLSQTRVAEALAIKKANFVALARELEQRGFVERRAIPGDKRSLALHLTPAGKLAYSELDRLSEEHEAKLREAIGIEAYEALFAPLVRLAKVNSGEASPPDQDPD